MKKIEKKKMYMIFGIVVLIIAIAGSAYAYYSASASATISGTAGGGNLTINVERLSTSANGDLIPLDNDTTTLNKAILGEGNTSGSFDNTKSCIDKNGYTACQVYKITISNTSSVPIVLNGGVSLSGNETPNIECAVMNNTNSLSSNTTCRGNKSLANKYSLGANTTKEYYILVYIKNIEEDQTDTGDFNGIVKFISSDGAEVKAKFEDNPALTTLNNLGLSVDTSHTPDFTTVSGNGGVKIDLNSGDTVDTAAGDGTNGIYKAEDDLGTSYYFRGDVHNNYVYFAKRWWQIIRINGDGTIRMIYTSNPNNSRVRSYIANSAYNQNYNDNAYVGYMYGTVSSSTYEATHSNTNDSTIKTVIDEWYQNHLSSYSSYIADAIYCNDREVVQVNDAAGMTFTGDGTGTNQSAYAGFNRTYFDHAPTLKCKNNNDRFTISSTLGNGALTYPIGLITADEVVMSGGGALDFAKLIKIENENYYLYPANNFYWTMTPFAYMDGEADVAFVSKKNELGCIQADLAGSNKTVRPVISLKADAITGGDGTASNPFYGDYVYIDIPDVPDFLE